MQDSQKILGGLFERCPLNDAVSSCPFVQIRELSVDEQFDLVREMPNEELEEMITHHKNCMNERMSTNKGFKIIRTEKYVSICPV